MTIVRRSELGMPRLAAIASESVATILSLQNESGAYPASPTFSAYEGYSWFRDGSFIADAMSAYGEIESADRFHDWCSEILLSRREQIAAIVEASQAGNPVASSRMLSTRFTFSGDEGSDDWWDFQLDGYGTWLWAVCEHSRRRAVPLDRWYPAIELATDYLLSSWDRPCFDWWEEREDEVHVSTLGCIAAGLAGVVADLDGQRQARVVTVLSEIDMLIRTRGVANGHLSKWLGSTDVDASLVALISPLGAIPVDDVLTAGTIAAVDRQLNVGGGVHRYLLDTFFGGGQWPLLSCMLGLAFAATGDRSRALDQLRWAASTVTEGGQLPEQVDDHLLFPERQQEWIDRWGTVATPLLWSHAMFVRLAVELGVER